MLWIALLISGCSDSNPGDVAATFFGEGLEDNVVGKSLAYSGYGVVYSTDGNDEVNPGEDVFLAVFIENNGTRLIDGITARLSTESIYVSYLSPSYFIDYGYLYPDDETWSDAIRNDQLNINYSYVISVSGTASPGTQIEFTLEIVDSKGSRWTETLFIDVE